MVEIELNFLILGSRVRHRNCNERGWKRERECERENGELTVKTNRSTISGFSRNLFLFLPTSIRGCRRRCNVLEALANFFLIKNKLKYYNRENKIEKVYIFSTRLGISYPSLMIYRSRDSLNRRWNLSAIILRVVENENTQLFVINRREKYLCKQLVNRSIA